MRALIANFAPGDVFSTPEIAENLVRIGAKPADFTVTTAANGETTVTAKGVAGHAMAPDKSDNALWKIWAVLEAIIPASETAKRVFDDLCRHDASKVIGAYREDKETGALTMNMGVAEYDGGDLTLKFDFRLPISAKPDETEAALSKVFANSGVIKRARFALSLIHI